MLRKIEKYRRESKKKKLEKRANLLFSSTGALLFLLTVFASYQLYMKKDFQQAKANKVYENIEIPAFKVCMSSDKIKVKPLLSVKIDGQTYFACCEKCLRKIEVNYNSTRVAIDPFSGNRMQKNESYIRLKENGGGKVYYFESEENFHNFRNQ